MDGEQTCLKLAQNDALMRRPRSSTAEIQQQPTLKDSVPGLNDEPFNAAEVAGVQEGQGHG